MRLIVACSGQSCASYPFTMRVQTTIILAVLVTLAWARPEESAAKKSAAEEPAKTAETKDTKSKRGLFDLGLGHDFAEFGHGLDLGHHAPLHHDEGHISQITIHKEVKVPVPAPYPVEHIKHVPYPVHVKVPVDNPVPYHVSVPAPYLVEKVKHVPYPVKVPVHIPVEEHYPVHVPVKVHVPVEKHVPYPVKVPYVVKESYPVYVHEPKHHHHDDHYGNLLLH